MARRLNRPRRRCVFPIERAHQLRKRPHNEAEAVLYVLATVDTLAKDHPGHQDSPWRNEVAIHKDEQAISTLGDWYRLAPPKQKKHWVAGRSAMEVARAWLAQTPERMPPEVLATLEPHPDFGPVLSWAGEPEARLPFDAFRGEPRNSDLAIKVTDGHGDYLLAVEAKADERFGETVAKTLAVAGKQLQDHPGSNRVRRLEQLLLGLLGARNDQTSFFGDLRYQLLTACAGALCEAQRQGYARTVMLVHEFHTARTDAARHRENAEDLNRFVVALSGGTVTTMKEKHLYGPFFVPGKPLLTAKIGLYIGKVSRSLT